MEHMGIVLSIISGWWFGTWIFFFHILGMSSFRLTFTPSFFSQPPTRISECVRKRAHSKQALQSHTLPSRMKPRAVRCFGDSIRRVPIWTNRTIQGLYYTFLVATCSDCLKMAFNPYLFFLSSTSLSFLFWIIHLNYIKVFASKSKKQVYPTMIMKIICATLGEPTFGTPKKRGPGAQGLRGTRSLSPLSASLFLHAMKPMWGSRSQPADHPESCEIMVKMMPICSMLLEYLPTFTP